MSDDSDEERKGGELRGEELRRSKERQGGGNGKGWRKTQGEERKQKANIGV